MDKLLSIAGGQPLRSDDWTFIQNATAEVVKSIIEGLAGQTGAVIISGCVITTDATYTYLSAGVVFDGSELRNVPARYWATQGAETDTPDVGTYLIYLTPTTATQEQRTFKDTNTHDVWESNTFTPGYAATVPDGSVNVASLDRLNELIDQRVLGQVPAPPDQVLSYVRKSFSAGSLDQSQIVINAPGAGKVIKVISMTARIVPATTLEVGSQDLYAFYDDHADTPEIGQWPNQWLESASTDICDITPTFDRLYVNSDVRIALSGATQPVSGSAQITIYCTYKVITL